MIYTVGLTGKYDAKLAAGRLFKYGKKPGYGGGWVFRTEEDARRYLERRKSTDRSVYGVLADWDADTEVVPGELYRHLLRASEVVRIDHHANSNTMTTPSAPSPNVLIVEPPAPPAPKAAASSLEFVPPPPQ